MLTHNKGGFYTDKKVWQAVHERSEGLCEFPTENGKCRGNYMVQQHHVCGKYNRARLEMVETIFDLCDNHHNNHSTGVHHNKINRKVLEDIVKDAFKDKGWSELRIAKELYGDAKEYRNE